MRARSPELVLLGRELLGFGFGAFQLILQARAGQSPRDDTAVGKYKRRRSRDMQLLAELSRLRDRRAAIALVIGQFARDEELVPRLGLVVGAPEQCGLARGIRMELIDGE